MSEKIIDLSGHRSPTIYTIEVAHHWDGRVVVCIKDIPENDRSKHSVMRALEASLKALRSHFKKIARD